MVIMLDSKLAFFKENAKKPAVYLSVEELSLMLGFVVEAKLKEFSLIPPIPQPVPERTEHLSFMQAVAYLKISRPTFVKLRREGKMKGMKVGEKRVLFSRSELDAYLQSNHE
jgi:excisionase family DNA binding protein